MKKLILSFLLIPFIGESQVTTGDIVGRVIQKKDKSSIYGARVQSQNSSSIYRAITEPDGRFRISGVKPGTYLFEIIFEGDTLSDISVSVPLDDIINIGDISFVSSTQKLKTMHVTPKAPSLKIYGVKPEIKMEREQIIASPQKFDQKSMIASMSSDIKLTDDGELVFRGARKGDMIYYMDGIKMNTVMNVPSASIGYLMAYTGGLPAKYGDTNGGVVVMESLSYFDLYRAWEAKQLRNED